MGLIYVVVVVVVVENGLKFRVTVPLILNLRYWSLLMFDKITYATKFL